MYNDCMNYLEEENKNLINLRTSLMTMIAVLTGGMFWLATSNFMIILKVFFILSGIYLDFLFLSEVIRVNTKINNNIGVIKNERR